jgi:general secretion pathway protein L
MEVNTVGIDIGSFSIKVAHVRQTSKDIELVSVLEYPLSQDPNKDNRLEIIEALRDISKRYDNPEIKFVTGLKLADVNVRRKSFPFKERHKILKSLPFELEEDIPLPADTAIYDAKITHFTGGLANCLAFATKKENIETLLQDMQDGTIDVDDISVKEVAAATLFEDWRETPLEEPENKQALPDSNYCDFVLSIGHRTTSLSVFKDGYLLDLRHLDWGGKELADSIAQKYSLHPLEAAKELRKKSFIILQPEGATKEQVALSESLKAALDPLAQQVRLLLLETTNLYNVKPRNGTIIGGVSQIRNIGAYFTMKLNVQVNRLAELPAFIRSVNTRENTSDSVAATAIGLALEGLKRPKNPALNFLKGDFEKKSQNSKVFWETWGSAIQVCVLAFFVVFVWSYFREDFAISMSEQSAEALRDQGKKITGKVSNAEIKKYIREQDDKLKIKQMVENLQNINSTSDIIKEISNLSPPKSVGKINIVDLQINSQIVILTGNAQNAGLIEQLQKSLKSVAKGGNLQVLNPPPAARGYQGFSFQFNVDRIKE